MSKKLTIGLILDDTLDRSDGVQQAVITIGEKLRVRGHDVHYIVSDTTRTDLKNIHSIGKSLALKFNGNSVRTPLPVSRKKIQELFSDVEFDVLHVQMPFSPLLAAKVLAMAPKQVKKYGTFHILPYNFVAKHGTKLLGIVMKRSIQSLDHCFAVSKPAKEFMDVAFNVDGSILPNPINYTFFHSFKRQKKTKKQIVFVGRFEERKGVRELVKAYSKIPQNLRDTTELTMISKGPLHDEVKKSSKNLNLNISFPGFVSENEKAQTLASADIAVYPSISGESFGIVLTEAMAAGAGVTLGGNNPGYSSVLGDWPNALFDPKNIPTFTETLVRYITDGKLRDAVGTKQHEAVKQYDVELVVNKLLETYQS
jgi:phosphatidylinositol alpha-mannosyltransferase